MKKGKTQLLMLSMALSLLFFVACKKSNSSPSEPEPVANGTRDELTKDSIFLYAKEIYYWNTSLPSYSSFNPRNFNSIDAELFALTQFSSNPSTGKPYEYNGENATAPKYSFFDYSATTGKVSALKADIGVENNYGFGIIYNQLDDIRVTYVYTGSPAAVQGLTRGCRIIGVNGKTDLSLNNTNISFLNGAVYGTNPSINLTFIDLNGLTKTVAINRATYTVNPILYTNVFTVGAKKVGYLVFNQFTNNISTQLSTVFNDFTSKGINELVVDLRYNGGGFVTTATQMINLIAPATQNGNVMYTTTYNNTLLGLTSLAARKASILAKQPLTDDNGNIQTFTSGVNGKFATYADLDYSPNSSDNIEKFAKSGALNINRVYFLVSDFTASASELVMNSLKPVMDVKLIGTQTYGKPVGFFPIRIDKVDMYIPEFETKNQQGIGGYYSGLTPDQTTFEDASKPFGDSNEVLLKYALNYALKGDFILPPAKSGSLNTQTTVVNQKLSAADRQNLQKRLNNTSFKGMIMKPHHKF